MSDFNKNQTLINLYLKIRGPLEEKRLSYELLFMQLILTQIYIAIKYMIK